MINKILTIAILIAIVGLIFIYHKNILIIFTKFFNGKYSPQYYNYHKKLMGRYPYPIAVKDNFIYYFRDLIKQDSPIIMSKESFDFEQMDFYVSESQIKKRFGKPKHFSAFKLNHCAKVLGYSSLKNNLKSRNLFFLYNNKFVMGINSYKDLDETQKEMLKTKFCLDLKIEKPDVSTFYVRDNKDNLVLFLDNGYAVRIKYFPNSDNNIYSKLKKELAAYLNKGRK